MGTSVEPGIGARPVWQEMTPPRFGSQFGNAYTRVPDRSPDNNPGLMQIQWGTRVPRCFTAFSVHDFTAVHKDCQALWAEPASISLGMQEWSSACTEESAR
jgi:hypothetical protein